jgi:c-di-GMP-binding flagellar brake protein YcgR
MTSVYNGWLEKRKYQRYPAREGAIVAFKPHARLLGQMIDISLGGLAFRYIESEEQPDQSVELIILVAHHSFRLDKVPFNTVCDHEIVDHIAFSSIKMRRRSVEFGNLSETQISAIINFIMNHTVTSSRQPIQVQSYQQQAFTVFQQI